VDDQEPRASLVLRPSLSHKGIEPPPLTSPASTKPKSRPIAKQGVRVDRDPKARDHWSSRREVRRPFRTLSLLVPDSR
jgi:hypothetical protein